MNMKGKLEENGVELDWLAREVLFSISAAGGKSNTSEIRQATDFHAEKIKYRFQKLENAELIEVGSPEQLPDGRMGPTPVEITQAGAKKIEEGFKSVEETLEERLQRIERRSERYKDLRRAYHAVKEENEDLHERVEELEHRLEQLEDWIKLDS